jgi:hypothetical protein
MIMCSMVISAGAEEYPSTSPLTVYSGGAAIGVIRAFNYPLKLESKTFFKLSFINDIYLKDVTHLFIDADWLAPRANLGMDIGLDYLPSNSSLRPFIGAGIGVRYFDKKGYKFGENFGPSATAHIGALIELSKTVQVRIRLPFHVAINETNDRGAGLDIGLLFSKPYKNVKKLNFN